MAIGDYDVGDLVRITGTLLDVSSNVLDPTGLVVKVETPAGVTTTLTYGTDVALVKLSTGVYYTDVNVTEAGYWRYRFAATGTGQAAAEGTFQVRESSFA